MKCEIKRRYHKPKLLSLTAAYVGHTHFDLHADHDLFLFELDEMQRTLLLWLQSDTDRLGTAATMEPLMAQLPSFGLVLLLITVS